MNVSLKLAVVVSGQKQIDVAKRAGLSAPRLSLIVNGRKMPRANERVAIARALGVPEVVLFPTLADGR